MTRIAQQPGDFPRPLGVPLERLEHERDGRERALPDSLPRALNAYRDRCWRGGDPTPERMCVEREIENYCAGQVSAVMDRMMPIAPSDDEMAQWLAAHITIGDEAAAAEGRCDAGRSELDVNRDVLYWATFARMLRTIRERLSVMAVVRRSA